MLVSAPTTSTAWIPARCSTSTLRWAPVSRWRDTRCRSPRPGPFGVIAADEDDTIACSREARRAPSVPDDPERWIRLDGELRFHHRGTAHVRCDDRCRRGRSVETRRGGDIIPALVDAGAADVYDFSGNDVPGQSDRERRGYWRECRDTRRVLRGPHGSRSRSTRCSSSTTTTGRSSRSGSIRIRPGRSSSSIGRVGGGRSRFDRASGIVVSGGMARRSVLAHASRPFVCGGHGLGLMRGVDVGRNAVVRRAHHRQERQIPAGVRVGVDLVAVTGNDSP